VQSADSSLVADVTVVVTTSAIPSHPSTALLDATLSSLALCSGGLDRCEVVISCDGYTVLEDGCSSQFKWGRLAREDANAYEEFLRRLARRVDAGDMGPRKVTLITLDSHHGFGHSVRAALVRAVSTRLVLVLQHDWLFVDCGFDAVSAAAAMLGPPGLPYVGAMSLATVDYEDRVRNRYQLDISSATVAACAGSQRFLPLLLLQDKPHLASRSYLLDFVYGPENAPPIGCFPEDSLGQRQLADIRANGVARHGQYRTYVLDQGRAVTYHLSGRKVIAAPDEGGVVQDATPRPAGEAIVAWGERVQQPVQHEAAADGAGFARGATWSDAVVAGLGQKQAARSSTQRSRFWTVNERGIICSAGGRPFRGRCFACGQKGHSKEYCPQRLDVAERAGGSAPWPAPPPAPADEATGANRADQT